MLFLWSVGRRSRKVEERDPFENEALPSRRRNGAPFRGFDSEPLEDRLVHGPRVCARVEGETEPLEQDGRVVRALGDQDELLGRFGDPDLRQRARKLVVAGDVQGELGAPVAETNLAAGTGTAEMGPGREEMSLSCHRTRVEEGDEGRRLLGQFPERSNDGVRGRAAGTGAAGTDRSDRSFLRRRKGYHGTVVTPA